MGRGVGDLLNTLMMIMPWWAVAGLLVLVLLLAIPGWRYSTRSRQIRGTVRRMVRAEPPDRQQLAARALDVASGDGHLLALVAREARKRSLPALYDDALRRLDDEPAHRAIAEAVRGEVAAKRAEPMHPAEAVVRVQALLEVGAVEAARLRVDEALEQHPRDPELLALRDKLATAAPAEASAGPAE